MAGQHTVVLENDISYALLYTTDEYTDASQKAQEMGTLLSVKYGLIRKRKAYWKGGGYILRVKSTRFSGWERPSNNDMPLFTALDIRNINNATADITPDQFYDELNRTAERSGEHLLMLEVLKDALDCYLNYKFKKIPLIPTKHGHRGELKRQIIAVEAEEWINDDDRTQLFSFCTICDEFGWNVSNIRRCIFSISKKPKRKVLRALKIVTPINKMAA